MICRRSGPFPSSAERPSENRAPRMALAGVDAFLPHTGNKASLGAIPGLFPEGMAAGDSGTRSWETPSWDRCVRRCARDRRSSPCTSEDPTASPVSEPRRSPAAPECRREGVDRDLNVVAVRRLDVKDLLRRVSVAVADGPRVDCQAHRVVPGRAIDAGQVPARDHAGVALSGVIAPPLTQAQGSQSPLWT